MFYFRTELKPDMTTESTREIDLLDHTWHTEDPWPTYTWLREEAPVYWDAQNELWGISRYDDIIRVSKDPETFSSEGGNVPNMPPDPSFINHDGVKHLRQKKLIQPHFTPARIAQLEQHIRGLARELLDEVGEVGLHPDDLGGSVHRLVIGHFDFERAGPGHGDKCEIEVSTLEALDLREARAHRRALPGSLAAQLLVHRIVFEYDQVIKQLTHARLLGERVHNREQGGEHDGAGREGQGAPLIRHGRSHCVVSNQVPGHRQ